MRFSGGTAGRTGLWLVGPARVFPPFTVCDWRATSPPAGIVFIVLLGTALLFYSVNRLDLSDCESSVPLACVWCSLRLPLPLEFLG